MSNIYTSAMIITDKNNKVVDCNHFARNSLKKTENEEMIGRDINIILKEKDIDINKILISEGKKYNIYVIKNETGVNGFFEEVLERSYDEIFVTDSKGVALYCNPGFEKHYGVKREDILGKDVTFLQKEGYVDKVMVHEVISTKQTITYKQNTTNGKVILNTIKPVLDRDGEVVYVIENCRDITEETQLERALRKKERQVKGYENKLKYFSSLSNENFINFESEAMKRIDSTVKKLALRDVNILLLGESGTGKTAMASYIHDNSLRRDKPFVTIDCTTIPDNLIESELFGHEKGSFTGAISKKEGMVSQADGGTLFFDEVGELPLKVQGKLLKIIQEKSFTSVGGIYPQKVDIRIIAATNKDIESLVKEGEFREDLYYRLALGVVTIPPLRERKEDIKRLMDHYIQVFNSKYGTDICLSEGIRKIFLEYSWPGNIRELEHILEFLVINSSDASREISQDYLPANMIKEFNNKDKSEVNTEYIEKNHEMEDFDSLISSYEKKLIRESYEKYKSSYKVAEDLKISQSKAYRLIKKYCE